jgi:hypothetical protein
LIVLCPYCRTFLYDNTQSFLPRFPDELPVGLETAFVVLGVEGFVEGAADFLRELRVA